MIQDLYSIHYNRPLTEDVWEMRICGDIQEITAPGQFLNIRLNGHFLRRPISICDWDEETAEITFLYKVVGKGTATLSQMRAGALRKRCGTPAAHRSPGPEPRCRPPAPGCAGQTH